MVEIFTDGPFVHEDVWGCWQDGKSCVVVPYNFPDPAKYLKKYEGPPALFQYVINKKGGYDIEPFPWTLLQKRFENAVSPKEHWDVTWGCVTNAVGYGLTFARLYPLWLGKRVIPFNGFQNIAGTIDGHGVTTMIADGNMLVNVLGQDKPQNNTLKRVINICRGMSVARAEAIEAFFGAPCFTALGCAETGLLAFTRSKELLRKDLGPVLIPHRIDKHGYLWVKPAAPLGEVDEDGYVKTNIKAELVNGVVRDLEA